MQNYLDFSGSDTVISSDELTEELLDQLSACGGIGQQDDNVAAVLRNFEVTGDPSDCRDYLRQYGAWDDDDLQDHETNLERLVWLAGCDLAQGDPAYFSTY